MVTVIDALGSRFGDEVDPPTRYSATRSSLVFSDAGPAENTARRQSLLI